MSLLIKALDKAQSAKAEEAQSAKTEPAKPKLQKPQPIEPDDNLTLSLSPSKNMAANMTADEPSDIFNELLGPSSTSTEKTLSTVRSVNVNAQSAANVFSSKGMAPKKGNQLLPIVAGLALITLLGMGAYFYRQINHSPEPAVVPRLAQAQIPAPPPVEVAQPVVTTPVESIPAAISAPEKELVASRLPPIITSNETVIFTPVKAKTTKKPQKVISDDMIVEDESIVADESAENVENIGEVSEPQVVVKKTAKSKSLKSNSAIASESASITPSGVSVSKNKSQAQVSPTLMRAYDAYNAGNDADAQKLYKQVLQHDIRNVDALLGLGAIAQRQGRLADANGWFGKVLEVEPRNSMAQAAMLNNNTQTGDINNETHLKNMLAKQPDDANLHAELGNYYAAQNQWPSAQQAYFDAYRLHASANNALNLAVSLDQMGKPKLALPYYQRALDLAQTGGNSIDKAALEARIAAIQ
jgi:Tfp pilus assembly protein PilF